MKITICKSLFLILFISNSLTGISQSFTVGIIIKNQPDNLIQFGLLKGDNFIVTDSTFAKNELVRFDLPKESKTGMYRLVLGQTKEAKVMGYDPQMLDFIFNKEDIVLETDFKNPEANTRVIQSAENKIWFRFKEKEKELKQQLSSLKKEVNYLWSADKKDQAVNKASEFNQLQIERNLYIDQSLKDTSLFVSKLIQTFREPILDGYLTQEQQHEVFQKDFLKTIDFDDEALIYSQAYTDKIFQYLVSFNREGLTQQQRETAYLKAVDNIVANTAKNKEVFEFIQDYLIHGFGVLQLEKVVKYISEQKYSQGK